MSEHLHPAPVEGCFRCDLSAAEQETPRTVEEAAWEEAEKRWPEGSTDSMVALLVTRGTFVAGATWQAARMPSVEQVAAWLWRVDHPARMDGAPLHAQRLYADKARALLALWGAL